jgi:hypothetical protein
MSETFGFGQKISLRIYDGFGEVGDPVFQSTKLRMDFEVYKLSEYVRGQIAIYNLSNETISAITHKGKYFSIYVSLHGQPWQSLVTNMYINNSHTEKQIPNAVTTLYGYSSQIGILDKEIKFTIGLREGNPYALAHVNAYPTVRRILVEAVKRAVGFAKVQWKGANGKYQPLVSADTIVRFINFSPESEAVVLDTAYGMHYTTIEGTLVQILRRFCTRYKLIFFSEGNDIVISYLPTHRSIAKSGYAQSAANPSNSFTIPLHQIRNNPVVTPAKIAMVVNLDVSITTGKIIDTSKVVEEGIAKIGTNKEVLQVGTDFISDAIKQNYPYYNVLRVTHSGSNFTSSWQTSFDAFSARDNAKLGDENNGSL